MSVPIIRIEIEGMKHTIMHAMTQYIAQMDEDIQNAVERACKPEMIADIIEPTARQEISNAVTNEVEAFYKYGPGRTAIREAVVNTLLKEGEEQ